MVSAVAVFMIMGVMFGSFYLTPQVKAAANITILSNTGYLDSYGYYHVVGEVQNIGDQAANFVRIDTTFFNSENSIIDTRFDLTMLSRVMAGRKSPFEVILMDATESAAVSHYTVNVTFSLATSIPAGLQILTQSSYVDNMGNMRIIGEIENFGTETANNVKIIATYYDNASKVLAAVLVYLDPIQTDLGPGQTAQFDIALSQDRVPYVSSYELTAESVQYSIVGPQIFDHDIEVTRVAPSKTVASQDTSLRLNVTVSNRGGFAETFNITAYANTIPILTQPISLAIGASATITFTWNTTGFGFGNYTTSAYASSVPGETKTSNNLMTDGWVIVAIAGDVKGDGIVDIYDAILLSHAFNSTPGSSNWNANADINDDNVVDRYDAMTLVNHYFQNYH